MKSILYILLLFGLSAHGQGLLIDSYRYEVATPADTGYRSLNFDGVNETVRLDSTFTNNVSFSANAFTINFWAKTGNTATLYIFGERFDASTRIYCLKSALGRYQFVSINGGVTGVDISTDATWEDDTWHMITIRNPATGQAEIFVDGDTTTVQVVATSGVANYTLAARPYIGAAGNGAAEWLGYITHFSVWRKWMDGDEIVELYNSGKLFDLTTHSAAADLTYWMKVDKNTSLTTSSGIEDGGIGNNLGTANNMEAGDLSTDIP